MLGLTASFLAGFAALVAGQVGDADYAPFFIGLAFVAAVEARAIRDGAIGAHRAIGRGAALVWLIAAAWVSVLLAWAATSGGGSGPPPGPSLTFLGIPVEAYYLVGLYGGTALVTVVAFGGIERRSGADDET